VSPPSHCVACEAPIALRQIPVISTSRSGALPGMPTRRIRLGRAVGARDGILFVLLAWRLGSVWALPAYCVFAANAVAISAIDIEQHAHPFRSRLRDAVLGAPLLVLASAGTHDWSALESARIGGAGAVRDLLRSLLRRAKASVSATCASPVCAEGSSAGLGYREVVAGFLISFVVAACPPPCCSRCTR